MEYLGLKGKNDPVLNKLLFEANLGEDSADSLNKFMDYIPKEENRLKHILNESDSLSISESLKESNNLDNLKRDYKNDDNGIEKENTLEKNNIIGQTSKPNTIKKDLNKSINPAMNNNFNNNKQPILFNNDNLINSANKNNNNNLNNISKPAHIKPA